MKQPAVCWLIIKSDSFRDDRLMVFLSRDGGGDSNSVKLEASLDSIISVMNIFFRVCFWPGFFILTLDCVFFVSFPPAFHRLVSFRQWCPGLFTFSSIPLSPFFHSIHLGFGYCCRLLNFSVPLTHFFLSISWSNWTGSMLHKSQMPFSVTFLIPIFVCVTVMGAFPVTLLRWHMVAMDCYILQH